MREGGGEAGGRSKVGVRGCKGVREEGERGCGME